MTARTKSYGILAVLLLAVGLTSSGCTKGGNPAGPDPVATPTPKPTPEAVLLDGPEGPVEFRGSTVGNTIAAPAPGTFIVKVSWEPTPESGGQMYLYLVTDARDASVNCLRAQPMNLQCPEITARDESPRHPKQMELHVATGGRLNYMAVQVSPGTRITGKNSLWFRPDS